MHPAAELLGALVISLIYMIVGAVKALIPAALLPKKSLKGQTVLVTGAGKNSPGGLPYILT